MGKIRIALFAAMQQSNKGQTVSLVRKLCEHNPVSPVWKQQE